MLSLTRQWRSFSTVASKFLEGATKTASASARNALDPPKIVIARKKDIRQSPLKMKFLVSLVRKAWVPDALAQLKFTPKHRAIDIKKLILRACTLAKMQHDAIPEELVVNEVMVTKGLAIKKMRIMGRGRTGFGYRRYSHVTVKLEKIDFEQKIRSERAQNQKKKWKSIQEKVEILKLSGGSNLLY